MTDANTLDAALSSIVASPRTLDLLRDLYSQALVEPRYTSHEEALDKFVALDPDKSALVYLLLRSSGARFVVEAGTSFGLSTVFLALAVGQNVAAAASGQGQNPGKVIATELEPSKAAKARANWKAAGEEVEPWIELREGDLRETLKTDLPEQVDFLLLDIWAPLALPALRLVHPRLRVGATVVVDNIISSRTRYQDLVAYLDDPANGFKSTDLPYNGGLRVSVYTGLGNK